MTALSDDLALRLARAGVTRRELEVLRYLVQRMTNREIAARLHLSVRTVESHVSSLLAKLAAGSRAELATLGASLLAEAGTRPRTNLPSRLASFVGRARELEELGTLLGSDRLLTLTGAAGAEVAPVVQTLLDAAPGIRVLATSREPLGVPGEVVYRVDPLPVPGQAVSEVAVVVGCDAVRLLADRARAASTGFRVTAENAVAVARLCRSLDGLPLALELIAPRLRTFTPQQLAELLGDRFQLLAAGGPALPARHRTLRGAIEWSYELLGEQERLLFTRLAVFAGSFSLAAVEAVCTDATLARSQVLELLPSLVDRSLAVVDPDGTANRYRLLESLRAYASERLDDGAEQSLRRRHAGYFVRLAEEAEPHLRGVDAPGWIDRLRNDHDNLVQALEWALGAGRPPAAPADALRLVGALRMFWEDTDQRRSAIAWAERALAAGAGPPAPRVKALLAASSLDRPGEVHRAARMAEEALTLAERLGDEHWLARARLELGGVRAYNHDGGGRAMDPLQAALAYFRSTGDRWHTGMALQTQSYVAEPAVALDLLGEAHRLYTQEGDLLRVANCAYLMAATLVRLLGDPDRAEPLAAEREADRAAALAYLRAALEVAALSAHPRTIPLALDGLAGLLAEHDHAAAILLYAAADARWAATHAPGRGARLDALRRAAGPDAFAVAWQRGRQAPLDEVVRAADTAVERAGRR